MCIERRILLVLAALALALVLGWAPAASAATFDVQVGSGGNNFSPANVTIAVGDTVRWTRMSGGHNMVADNGSFRCANGCDGQGGNGNVSGTWATVTVTFNQPGTVRYFCEAHGGPGGIGMAGTITVQGAASAGELRFTTAGFSVNEGGGAQTITVERTNGTAGTVGVTFLASNGSASANADFTPATGTLSWGNGVGGNQSFSVAILEDSTDEPNETVNLAISLPTGGAALGSPSTATLTIVDNDSAGTAGSLGFSSSAYSAGEAAGTVQVSVLRTSGSTGAVAVDYATSPGSALEGSDYTGSDGTLNWPSGDAAAKSFTVPILDDGATEATETVNLTLSDPTGGAALGNSTATLSINDNDAAPSVCTPDAQTLCLNQQRFQIRVTWRNFQGDTGVGFAVDIGRPDSGLFYFFNPNNLEMLIKVLNACSLNQRYWVFFAATTNVEFEVAVVDTDYGTLKTYRNPLGQRANAITDTDAFATCP